MIGTSVPPSNHGYKQNSSLSHAFRSIRLSTGLNSVQSSVPWCFQREYPAADPAFVELLGTDELTTCEVLLTSVGHLDRPRALFYRWMAIRRMCLDDHPGFDCGGTLWFSDITGCKNAFSQYAELFWMVYRCRYFWTYIEVFQDLTRTYSSNFSLDNSLSVHALQPLQ